MKKINIPAYGNYFPVQIQNLKIDMPRAGFNISLTSGLIDYQSRILRIETMIWTNKKLIAKVNISFNMYVCIHMKA